jgi:hypothetical protein
VDECLIQLGDKGLLGWGVESCDFQGLCLMPCPVFFPLTPLQPAMGTTWSLRSRVPHFCPHLPRTVSPIMPKLTLSPCRASPGATPMLCLHCPQGRLGMGPPEWISLGLGSVSRRSLARASLVR